MQDQIQVKLCWIPVKEVFDPLAFFKLWWATWVLSLAAICKISDMASMRPNTVGIRERWRKQRGKNEAKHSRFLAVLLDKWTGILCVVGAGI